MLIIRFFSPHSIFRFLTLKRFFISSIKLIKRREKKMRMNNSRNGGGKKAKWHRKEGRKSLHLEEDKKHHKKNKIIPYDFFITVAKYHILWQSDMIWQLYVDECNIKNPFKFFYHHFGAIFRHTRFSLSQCNSLIVLKFFYSFYHKKSLKIA